MIRRLTLAILLAVLLGVGVLGGVVLGQEEGTAEGGLLARVQPLLVSIEQRVPVSITVTIPVSKTETQTVTVPAVVDLNLQITIADTVEAEVAAVTPATPAIVSVSELAAEGEPLEDNLGLAYQLEEAEGVELIQWRTRADYADDFELVGELRNVDEARPLEYLTVLVRLYDEEGAILDVASGYASLDAIGPGRTSPFQVMTSTPLEDVASYLVQVEADFGEAAIEELAMPSGELLIDELPYVIEMLSMLSDYGASFAEIEVLMGLIEDEPALVLSDDWRDQVAEVLQLWRDNVGVVAAMSPPTARMEEIHAIAVEAAEHLEDAALLLEQGLDELDEEKMGMAAEKISDAESAIEAWSDAIGELE